MESENLQQLTDEVKLRIPEVISQANLNEVFRNPSIPEGVKVEIKLSNQENLLVQICHAKFINCPCNQHRRGNCIHEIDCNTNQPKC